MFGPSSEPRFKHDKCYRGLGRFQKCTALNYEGRILVSLSSCNRTTAQPCLFHRKLQARQTQCQRTARFFCHFFLHNDSRFPSLPTRRTAAAVLQRLVQLRNSCCLQSFEKYGSVHALLCRRRNSTQETNPCLLNRKRLMLVNGGVVAQKCCMLWLVETSLS